MNNGKRTYSSYEVYMRNFPVHIFYTIWRANEIIFFFILLLCPYEIIHFYRHKHVYLYIYAYLCTLNFSFNKKRAIIQTIDLSYTPAYAFFFFCLLGKPSYFIFMFPLWYRCRKCMISQRVWYSQ